MNEAGIALVFFRRSPIRHDPPGFVFIEGESQSNRIGNAAHEAHP
jgi:hypothetical protein